MNKLLLLPALLLVTACGSKQTAQVSDQAMHQSENASHGMDVSSADRLHNSPRHQEWVEVDSNGKKIYMWVVYPETSEKVPVVLLIHENKGLSDWVRGMADQVAEAGYIAVAPDLLSGFSAEQTRTTDFADQDAATSAISQLKPQNVTVDLQAVIDWAKTIPSSNGKLASAGFCWGGARSFELGTATDDLDAVLVFYGTGPTDTAAYAKITAPVFGFYGGADERVDATIPASEVAMKAAGKEYDYTIYDGAGHAFMRSGEDPSGEQANVDARNAAWERMKEILSNLQ